MSHEFKCDSKRFEKLKFYIAIIAYIFADMRGRRSIIICSSLGHDHGWQILKVLASMASGNACRDSLGYLLCADGWSLTQALGIRIRFSNRIVIVTLGLKLTLQTAKTLHNVNFQFLKIAKLTG